MFCFKIIIIGWNNGDDSFEQKEPYDIEFWVLTGNGVGEKERKYTALTFVALQRKVNYLSQLEPNLAAAPNFPTCLDLF